MSLQITANGHRLPALLFGNWFAEGGISLFILGILLGQYRLKVHGLY